MTFRLRVVVIALLCACGKSPRPSTAGDSAVTSGPSSVTASDDSTLITVRGPTLLAVAPYSHAYLDTAVKDASADSSGLATALDDFSFYLGTIDSAMSVKGVRVFLRVDTLVKWVLDGRRDSMQLRRDSGVAYLVWGPRGFLMRRGVQTDVDLMALVDSVLPRRP